MGDSRKYNIGEAITIAICLVEWWLMVWWKCHYIVKGWWPMRFRSSWTMGQSEINCSVSFLFSLFRCFIIRFTLLSCAVKCTEIALMQLINWMETVNVIKCPRRCSGCCSCCCGTIINWNESQCINCVIYARLQRPRSDARKSPREVWATRWFSRSRLWPLRRWSVPARRRRQSPLPPRRLRRSWRRPRNADW